MGRKKSSSEENIFIPHKVNNFPLDLRNAGMSLGPIRELSAGPKPGGVSTFTEEKEREQKTRVREAERRQKYKVKFKKTGGDHMYFTT